MLHCRFLRHLEYGVSDVDAKADMKEIKAKPISHLDSSMVLKHDIGRDDICMIGKIIGVPTQKYIAKPRDFAYGILQARFDSRLTRLTCTYIE